MNVRRKDDGAWKRHLHMIFITTIHKIRAEDSEKCIQTGAKMSAMQNHHKRPSHSPYFKPAQNDFHRTQVRLLQEGKAKMGKKGLSMEEKKAKVELRLASLLVIRLGLVRQVLELMYERKEPFQLKELEKLAPKEKGVIAQSVKDIVQVPASFPSFSNPPARVPLSRCWWTTGWWRRRRWGA